MSAKVLLAVLVGAAVGAMAQAGTSPEPILVRVLETRQPEQADPPRAREDASRSCSACTEQDTRSKTHGAK